MQQWQARRSEIERASTPGFSTQSPDSAYQRDRARIIHSASFRSLQSKTQVLGMGESDFYRTRLTHSLEVAQIGSGICERLRENESDPERAEWIPGFSLIEAICLAHDIGHAPFGHGGEIALNSFMFEHGGFEANGQTLRICARLGEYSEHEGLDLSRRTMLGTLKYPTTHDQAARYPAAAHQAPGAALGTPYLNIDPWTPPKCVYDCEADVLKWLFEPFTTADRIHFTMLKDRGDGKHLRTLHKPFDTSIMELADDIAYGIHDLEDALTLGLVQRAVWQERVADPIRARGGSKIAERIDDYEQKLFSDSPKDRKHAISRLVSHCIQAISIEEKSGFEHPLLKLQARIDPETGHVLALIKDFVMDHVIQRPELQMIQYKGQQVMVRLFEIFIANPERLLPLAVQAEYDQIGRRAIADYLAGLTDISAGKLYHKLLSPAAGSIFDRH